MGTTCPSFRGRCFISYLVHPGLNIHGYPRAAQYRVILGPLILNTDMRKLLGIGRYQVVVGLAVLAISVGIAMLSYHWISNARRGELGEKEEYSVLQTIEFENRMVGGTVTPIIKRNVSNSGYDILGVPTLDKEFPRTWIILNKTAPSGKIMLVPTTLKFHADCAFVAALRLKAEVDPTVFAYLQQNCGR